jgi:hypothetical protein
MVERDTGGRRCREREISSLYPLLSLPHTFPYIPLPLYHKGTFLLFFKISFLEGTTLGVIELPDTGSIFGKRANTLTSIF